MEIGTDAELAFCCFVTNDHRLSSLKQHKSASSWFVWASAGSSAQGFTGLKSKCHLGLCPHLEAQLREGPAFTTPQVVLHSFPVVPVLSPAVYWCCSQFPAVCWCCSQLLETALRPLPCGPLHRPSRKGRGLLWGLTWWEQVRPGQPSFWLTRSQLIGVPITSVKSFHLCFTIQPHHHIHTGSGVTLCMHTRLCTPRLGVLEVIRILPLHRYWTAVDLGVGGEEKPPASPQSSGSRANHTPYYSQVTPVPSSCVASLWAPWSAVCLMALYQEQCHLDRCWHECSPLKVATSAIHVASKRQWRLPCFVSEKAGGKSSFDSPISRWS